MSVLSNLTETHYYNYAIEFIKEKLENTPNKKIVLCNKCFQECLILDKINSCLLCGSRPTNRELVNDIVMDTQANGIRYCPHCTSPNIYCLNMKFLCLDCMKDL